MAGVMLMHWTREEAHTGLLSRRADNGISNQSHIPVGVPHHLDNHLRVTYNSLHVSLQRRLGLWGPQGADPSRSQIAIQQMAPKIKAEFDPDLMIAIGGGGYIPARMLVSSAALQSRLRR